MKKKTHIMLLALSAQFFIQSACVHAAPKDFKALASWSIKSSDTSSDTMDSISSVPRYNSSEIGIAYFIYKAEKPGDTKYLASIKLVHYNRQGKKTEAEIPLENTKHITKSDKLELVALSRKVFFFTREYSYSDTETDGDTTKTTALKVLNVTRVDFRTSSIGTDNTVTLTDSEKVTTKIGETVISITGREEALGRIYVLANGVFASGTTRLYIDSQLEPGFCWGRIYDLKLIVEKAAAPSEYLSDGTTVDYFSNLPVPSNVVMEKKKVISDTERDYEVIIYR